MLSVAASHTSGRSKKSSKHDKPRSERSHKRSKTPDGVEKLVVKTADIQLESNVKTDSPRPEVPAESLAVMVGGPSRRSRCAPEFLQEMANRSSAEIYEEFGKKFTIITGSEAVTVYKKFLGGKSTEEIVATKENAETGKEGSPFIVFAVTVTDAGRRLVDYYTTWRGKTSAKDLTERRLKFLDSQFRKAARVLDNEFKRVFLYGAAAGVPGSTKSSKSKKEPEEPPTTKPRPPNISAPPPELKVDAPKSPSSPPPPLSATDSVMSLPFLNMIRNVPLGHRVPLRVTNPDRLSMISSDIVVQGSSPTNVAQPAPETALASIAETEENPQNLLTPEVVRASSHSIRSAKSSAASTASTESHRSKHKSKEIPEFLFVLLDDRTDKDSRTWHGLERQVSRTSARTTPSRVSLWDGPLARDNGITYSTPPVRPSPQKGEDSSEEEDWENSPVIPILPDPYRLTRSASESRHLPMIPATAQYRMASANSSPVVSFANLSSYSQTPSMYSPSPYPPSPYAQPYASPYQSPIMPPGMRPLPRSRYQPPAFHP
ncbi:hypothetical protein LshimejAT787_1401480 [Lyophyllum shimeji]|uniref:Uncharacterized protein n=1 Tax=Lyophyllum shimeji TaxID=47721 RepID=A0A9P3PYV8_LYOSH|nr:hypothetical protein LshimejAT787_1401480 [Lyophyllum shimeji]